MSNFFSNFAAASDNCLLTQPKKQLDRLVVQRRRSTSLRRVLLTRMLHWRARQDVGMVDGSPLRWSETLKCRHQRKGGG